MHHRRVLITGAGGGLGRIMADTLAELGADLILVDRSKTALESLEEGLRSKWGVGTKIILCDLESERDRLSMIASVKDDGLELNCLINNAAFVGASDLLGWSVSFEDQTLDTWRRAVEVNLTAGFHLSQAFTPSLRNSKGGNIINIASIYGEFGPDWRLYEGTTMANPAAYAASKGGIVQLTHWLATTLAPDIRVNSISPGGIFRNQPAEFVRRYEDRVPMKRMATENDFRGSIAFLASDLSAYITGQVLRVDGGWSTW
ncbi:SDR family oxidoreductase [Leptospira brenneri]|uniref:SDR family oxidoreductase n=1 Tax=Leptospira brenneri TaxID=2023182 RepID=A0A2M9Y2P3_9LEPT|nr:SDR family oxidoreductase [Leptospira brenneri]PJZ45656.1 short-chain dehydrogenase [Leptospira brenneri]TGK92010.1 SDR family oxidoreductase [Leptospira brenneri]